MSRSVSELPAVTCNAGWALVHSAPTRATKATFHRTPSPRRERPLRTLYHSTARPASRTMMCEVMVCIPLGIAFTVGCIAVVPFCWNAGDMPADAELYHQRHGGSPYC